MSKKIVVVGSSNTDMIIKTDHIPRPGETVIGGTFSTAAGGKGANQAVAAARAGGEVTLVARVGTDMFGDQAIEGFIKDNIDVKYVIKDPHQPSGMALIFVDEQGENSIAVASGANGKLSPADVQAASGIIAGADVIVMQLETPLDTIRAAVAIADPAGVKVILNPAPAQPLDEGILSKVSVLTPNESEAELRAGFAVLFAANNISLDAQNPEHLVLFPEMDAARDVAEISSACWSLLGVDAASMMCATSRMVVHRKGAARPAVVACTLLPYAREFELGDTLAAATKRPVSLNHPHCARFCVLGGGACSATAGES